MPGTQRFGGLQRSRTGGQAAEGSVSRPQEGRTDSHGAWNRVPHGGTVPGVGRWWVTLHGWTEPARGCCSGPIYSLRAREVLTPGRLISKQGEPRDQRTKVTLAQQLPAQSPSGRCRVIGRGLALPQEAWGSLTMVAATERPLSQTCQ